MIKNEQSRNINQQIRSAPNIPISVPVPPPPPLAPVHMPQTTLGMSSQRLINTNAIDITSLKGQFAWEKIPYTETYMPVIFRNNTKYFSVRMLRKLLPEYPEDVLRRTYQYQYRKTIDLYPVTQAEVDLLNRINSHHSRSTYSQQPFTRLDQIVRVSDFILFYEHLRHGNKSTNTQSNTTTHALRQLLPQAQAQQHHHQQQQFVQRSNDFMSNMPTILRGQPTLPQNTSVLMSSSSSCPPTTDVVRDNLVPMSRAIPPAPTLNNVQRPVRPVTSAGNSYAILFAQRAVQCQPPQPTPPLLNVTTSSLSNTVSLNNPSPILNTTPISLPPSVNSSSPSPSSASPTVSSLTNGSPCSTYLPVPPPPAQPSLPSTISAVSNRTLSTSSISPPTSTTPTLPTKSPRLHCGWLQINKLYTPYISPGATNHHLYKLPVSLLSFYKLLKTSSTNDSKEAVFPFEQIPATSQELESINELCTKQSIQPFSPDTKFIELSTFYEYTSANIIFIKELPLTDPKASICKDWANIVQINGGICRLRNITTLHEQTVPFIGNNLLKNFSLSPQSLSTASLTKPTNSELEFLQLILFLSNMSINLPNAQLIDIQSVKKEYTVDLILLFNDKFPLNVLNYQQQGNRPNPSQTPIIPTNSTNTIAESTPPPSPPSPPTNQVQTNPSSQLPLTSSTQRYFKTIDFHGHSLIAYICSGLGTNAQRECISIKSLCNILYPNAPSLDKIELVMLRLLRSKNINRFRPQNQKTLGMTRLIDIKDAEQHWNYLETEMRAILDSKTNNEKTTLQSNLSSIPNDTSKASTVERVENTSEPVPPPPSSSSSPPEISHETNKGEKRLLNETLDDEDLPISERINKRRRTEEKENSEKPIKTTNAQSNDKTVKKRTIKLHSIKINKKRLVPSARTSRQSMATWVRKYNIEDCCIKMNKYDPVYDSGTD